MSFFSLLGAWRVLLDPHFMKGKLDFCIGLQTSRPRFDDGRTLGAAKMQSGYPPANRAGHKWARTAKAGLGVS